MSLYYRYHKANLKLDSHLYKILCQVLAIVALVALSSNAMLFLVWALEFTLAHKVAARSVTLRRLCVSTWRGPSAFSLWRRLQRQRITHPPVLSQRQLLPQLQPIHRRLRKNTISNPRTQLILGVCRTVTTSTTITTTNSTTTTSTFTSTSTVTSSVGAAAVRTYFWAQTYVIYPHWPRKFQYFRLAPLITSPISLERRPL